MPKPEPKKIEPAELRHLSLTTMKEAKFPQLASMDSDQPRVRPVSPVRTDDFVVYVANMRFYHKTSEIAANPKVELCYIDDHHNQVRITGVAEVLKDRSLLQEIWDSNALMRQYLQSIDNPQLIVYKVVPNRVRYMQEWAIEYYEVKI